jgi:hypothetical protein
MSPTVLVTRLWDGNVVNETVLESPASRDVDAAIAALDQVNRDEVVIERPDGRSLLVGGGAGSYVVQAMIRTRSIEMAMNIEGDSTDREIVIGNQRSRIASKYVVPMATASAAARVFANDGTLAEDVTWITHPT